MTHPFTEAEVEDFEHYFSRVIQEGENGAQIVEKPPITMINWLRAHDDRVRADEQRRIWEGIEAKQFEMKIQEYLPLVKAWQGGFDIPFDHGYAKGKADALSVITPEDTTSDKTKV